MSNHRLFLQGIINVIPLLVATIPFALVYGAMAQSINLPLEQVLGMSIFVFAGSAQFVAVTLLNENAAIAVIILTVFIINLRHLLYSVSLMPHVNKLSQKTRIAIAFLLTDEVYATLSNELSKGYEAKQIAWYYFGAAVIFYMSWILCSWLGFLFGVQIPELTEWGLDVAMVVAFVGIVAPSLKTKAHWGCAITAFVLAVLTHAWPHQTGLLFSSIIAIILGVALNKKQMKTNTRKLI